MLIRIKNLKNTTTKTGKKFYFYHLSKYKNYGRLFEFNYSLLEVDKIYSDRYFSYKNVYQLKIEFY